MWGSAANAHTPLLADDKYTLGAKCTAGDKFDMANPLARMAFAGTFEPRDDEASRVTAGGAMIAALQHEAAVEFTLSAAKAEAPPTEGEWEALLSQL